LLGSSSIASAFLNSWRTDAANAFVAKAMTKLLGDMTVAGCITLYGGVQLCAG
jgi:hypothetical protein